MPQTEWNRNPMIFSRINAIDCTDLQSKTSVDEISLLWLFCECWTRIWY